MARVKNINGTSDSYPPYPYTTWKEYYISKRSWPTSCACLACTNKAEVGAHVIKVNSYDRRWYIAPLCRECNGKRGQELDVVENWLVPENDR